MLSGSRIDDARDDAGRLSFDLADERSGCGFEKGRCCAGFINSSLSGEQLKLVYERARQGAYRILYIAPERLETEGFVTLTKSMPISLVAVDEAHCISQWGTGFPAELSKDLTF